MAIGFSAVGKVHKMQPIALLENFSHLHSIETSMSIVPEWVKPSRDQCRNSYQHRRSAGNVPTGKKVHVI
jgi:hypothetical protein